MRVLLLVALAATALAAPTTLRLHVDAAVGNTTGPLEIPTSAGTVRGFALPTARVWKGIPYAQPPVGDLRWQNPEPATPWSGVLTTTAFGPACPQDCKLPPLTCQPQISEDCLFLNVYAPLMPKEKVPVLVFFHGGRYEQGSEGVELYDGQMIAQASNAVVVTVNYRLGVLGFLTLPSGFVGNYAVRDQQLSLQWVRDNVAAFGGDPAKVTIFGQSAGGTSTSVHLVSKHSKNLFSQAIVESSPYSLPLLSMEAAYKHYEHFSAETPCSTYDTACLRGLTWQQVVDAQMKAQQKIYLQHPLVLFFPWTPVIDGDVLTDDPLTLINQGKYNKVPLIIGTVAEEALMFVYDGFGKLNKEEAQLLIDAIFRKETGEIFSLYQLPESMPDYRPWVSHLASDFIMHCTARNVSRVFARDGLPVYRYLFNHSWAMHGGWGPDYPYCEGHSCHGVELPFVFNSASLLNFSFTPAEEVLAKKVSGAWGTFAVTGSANGAALPNWPQVDQATDALLFYSTINTTTVNHFRKEYCDFWDNFGYIF